MALLKSTRQGNVEKPVRFRVKPPESRWYSSLPEFLSAARESGVSPLYDLAQTSASGRARKRSRLEGFESVVYQAPWLTFVLGTGCLALSDAVAARGSGLDPLYAAFDKLDQGVPGLLLGSIASQYFKRLLVDREVMDTNSLVSDDPDAPQDWEYTAKVILAAALGTKTYASALAHSAHILTSSHRERVEFDPRDDEWLPTQTSTVDPFTAVLGDLSDAGRTGGGARLVLGKLCEEVRTGLVGTRGSLLRANVELLTAFTWYFVTLGTATYPGWSELLLIEALQASTADPGDAPPRPHLRNLTNETFSTHSLQGTSRRSWATRTEPRAMTSRDRFYDSVARVLRQQSEVYSAGMGVGGRPPLPVAHVTSFDLELEMALWSIGKPFVVVIPLLAVSEDHSINSASVHWLWARITPDLTIDHAEQFEALRGALKAHDWYPADETAWGRSSSRYNGEPVVVRLAGSPLMEVPSAEVTGIATSEPLHHALLLDEYSAWQQAILELSQLRGLAKAFTRATPDVPRFWLFLGTQLSDGAIRIRLLTHEFAALAADQRTQLQAQADVAEPAEPTDDDEESAAQDADRSGHRAGIVVNRWSRATDRDLFHWHRLDVIQASHSELQPLIDTFLTKFEDRRLTQLRALKVSAA